MIFRSTTHRKSQQFTPHVLFLTSFSTDRIFVTVSAPTMPCKDRSRGVSLIGFLAKSTTSYPAPKWGLKKPLIRVVCASEPTWTWLILAWRKMLLLQLAAHCRDERVGTRNNPGRRLWDTLITSITNLWMCLDVHQRQPELDLRWTCCTALPPPRTSGFWVLNSVIETLEQINANNPQNGLVILVYKSKLIKHLEVIRIIGEQTYLTCHLILFLPLQDQIRYE